MAYTLAQHDALEEAIATGASTVKYDTKSVTYRSQSEMMALLRLMKKELGIETKKSLRQLRVNVRKDS